MKIKQHYMRAGRVLNLLLRSAKGKFLAILAITAIGVAVTLSHADPGGSQPDQNNLAGAWLKPNGQDGLTPLLTTFTSDGTLSATRCIMLPTGPLSAELVSTGHGQWVRTGHNEFTATTIFLRSGIANGSAIEFTGLVKLIQTLTLNRAGDQLTSVGTLYIYDADGHLLFPAAPGTPSVATRIIAGQ
jgi:hypothetical protein